MLFVKMRPAKSDVPWLFLPAEDLFVTMGELGEAGATWEVQMLDEMTDAQFAELPEFDGW